MENDLIKRLNALAKVLGQKRDIETATLERLNKEMDGLAQRQTDLEKQNREEMTLLSLPGPALSQWIRHYQILRSENTSILWRTKATFETQKLALRRVIAQHQAIQRELERAIEEEKSRKNRQADYAS